MNTPPKDRISSLSIHPDITLAGTLPGWFYSDREVFELQNEKIFQKSWQYVGEVGQLPEPGSYFPATVLDEPLLVVKDQHNKIQCLSNVCTHRGTVLCEKSGNQTVLRCRYHGRRFSLDGKMISAPEFEAAKNFPSSQDDLPKLPIHRLGPLLFASVSPNISFEEWILPIQNRCGFMPFDRAQFEPKLSNDYLIRANWALYCDNYLEGFHIPYVHPTLAEVIDYSKYDTEIFSNSNLQIGTAKEGEEIFLLPKGHTDQNQNMGAYYWWLFPNLMMNLYPWGISLNVVTPLQIDQTKVSFLAFVWDVTKLGKGAGQGLEQVEKEDEAVVEAVQKGTRGRLYTRGRYSPKREKGVHHFHRLMIEALTS